MFFGCKLRRAAFRKHESGCFARSWFTRIVSPKKVSFDSSDLIPQHFARVFCLVEGRGGGVAATPLWAP